MRLIPVTEKAPNVWKKEFFKTLFADFDIKSFYHVYFWRKRRSFSRKLKAAIIGLALASLIPTLSQASSVPALNNITATDFEKVVQELSANFAYSSINPASSLGHIWGFEVGALAGYTKTPEILNLVKTYQPTTSLKDKFPHASALARLSVPYGITAEAIFFPKITVSDISIKQYGGALMWTITDVFFEDLPVTLATKAFFTKTNISYKQTINNSTTSNINVDATIDFDDMMYGAQALVSKKLFLFEPYAGFGYVRAKGDLSVNAAGSATIFSSAFTTGKSATSKPTTLQVLLGSDFQIAFFTLGAEYQRAFSKNSYTARLSFRF